jgi:hypothetical protein
MNARSAGRLKPPATSSTARAVPSARETRRVVMSLDLDPSDSAPVFTADSIWATTVTLSAADRALSRLLKEDWPRSIDEVYAEVLGAGART